jgi:hypothetical protein
MLSDLGRCGLPDLEGQDDVAEDGEGANPEGVVAEIVIETGRDIAGAITASERDEP